jgi:hypothetical protein
VSASVTGLTANTTYHFRISAANAGGTSYGSDHAFTTLPGPPMAVTDAASAVAQTFATLNATVNPNGGAVEDCHFDYGITTSYGSSAPCTTHPGSGIGSVSVSAPAGGLAAGSNYYFRIVATNPGGTSYGAAQPLTTQLPTTALPQQGPDGQGVSQGVMPELASTSLTASSSGTVDVDVTCPAGETRCAGRVILRTLKAVITATGRQSTQPKAAVLTLASGLFNLAGGLMKRVTLHLSAKARALLARTRVLQVRAAIITHDSAGVTHTVHTNVTLRARRYTPPAGAFRTPQSSP